MAQIKVADLFAQLGIRADTRKLDQFQKRLVNVKRQLQDLKRIARTPLSPNTNIAAVRALNTELARTQRLARQIQNSGTIRVNRSGSAGGRGRGGGGAGRAAGFGGATGGLLAASGAGRLPVAARGFIGTFAGAIVIRRLFQASSAMEGIRVALGAITREGQTTGEVMKFLRDESDRLGFQFETSALEFAKLAAAGNAAKLSIAEIQNIFIGAQEASRVFSLSASSTQGVLKAFTQIISKGKVTAEELRNQLGDQLPAAVPIFAAALGVTTQELSLMLEKGEILANDTLPLFATRLRETFGDAVPAASQNLSATFNRFINSLLFFLAELGEAGATDIFKTFLTGAANIFKILTPLFKGLITVIKVLISPFRALGRIIERPLNVLPNTTAIILSFATALLILRTALAQMTIAWVVAFAPVLATFGALAVGAILIEDWLVAIEGGDSILGRMAMSTNLFSAVLAGMLVNLGKGIRFMGELVAAIASGDFDELTESFKRFVTEITNFFRNPISEGITDLLAFVTLDENQSGRTGLGDFVAGAGDRISSLVSPNPAQDQPIVVTVEGDTEVIRSVTVNEMTTQLRQAQAENGNND